jgi:type IV secretion system protein VirB11
MIALKNLLIELNKYINRKNHNGAFPNDIILKNGEIELYYSGELVRLKNKSFNDTFIETLCQQIAYTTGVNFNSSNPILKSNLPNSLNRFTATHKIISGDNFHCIVIRLHNSLNNPSLEDFSTDDKFLSILKNEIKKGTNILISGETGSGKTSFLNAMVALFPDERLVTVENSLEINVPDNISSKQQLILSGNKISNIGYSDLIDVAMRLNPKRLIIGEVDTQNAQTYLRISNTGHKGVYSTIHANSCSDAFIALDLNLRLNNNQIPQKELFTLVKKSIGLLVHIHNKKVVEFLFTQNLISANSH